MSALFKPPCVRPSALPGWGRDRLTQSCHCEQGEQKQLIEGSGSTSGVK